MKYISRLVSRNLRDELVKKIFRDITLYEDSRYTLKKQLERLKTLRKQLDLIEKHQKVMKMKLDKKLKEVRKSFDGEDKEKNKSK